MKLKFKDIPKYCISLERSTDRRAIVKREFERVGIDFQFWDAVDRNEIVVPELSNKENPTSTFPLAPGILACMMSHLGLMRVARKEGKDVICVFEDDIIFCDDFNERIKYMEELPGFDFDMLSLGGHFPNVTTMAGAAHGTEWNHIYQLTAINGTYGYIITGKMMDFCIRNLHYDFGIDQFFGDHLYRRFKSLAFVPFLVGVRPCKSEITGSFSKWENTKCFYQQEAIENLDAPYINPLTTQKDRDNALMDKMRDEKLKAER